MQRKAQRCRCEAEHHAASGGTVHMFAPSRRRPTALPGGGGIAARCAHAADARNTYASLMIVAGVNAKAVSTFLGHASIDHHATSVRPPVARL